MEEILSNKYFIGICAAIGSMLLTILARYLLNKSSRFRYYVWHNRVGLSTDDSIFGSVRVLWNNTPISNLYLSTVELFNESLKDYENVTVRVFTNDTNLLSEMTEIVGTTYSLSWTKEFFDKLTVDSDQDPSSEQIELYVKQREYLIPTMNRGQVIRFTFLNSAKNQNQPTIWLNILHKGIKLNFGVAHNKIFNVSQPTAGLVGLMLGIIVIGFITYSINTIWLAAILSFIYGLFAQIPGAITVKLWRNFKQILGN